MDEGRVLRSKNGIATHDNGRRADQWHGPERESCSGVAGHSASIARLDQVSEKGSLYRISKWTTCLAKPIGKGPGRCRG